MTLPRAFWADFGTILAIVGGVVAALLCVVVLLVIGWVLA